MKTKKKELKIGNMERGFSLVEVMISIGLFTVIMVIGIGAILGVNATSRKTQSMRAIIDNLSFVMEDMARSMRLGDYFVCVDAGAPTYDDVFLGGTGQVTSDGPSISNPGPCQGIAFEPYWNFLQFEPTNQVVYYINSGAIWKKEPENLSFSSVDLVPITPSEITIDSDKSGFFVVGSDRTDGQQPRVTIVLVGTVNIGGVSTEFNMQTTVSQRVLDVVSIPPSAGSTGTTGTSTGTTIPTLPTP